MYKPDKPSTIAYDYMFNYFGSDQFKNKIITGANVQLAIRAYKDGKEVKFEEEPEVNNTFLCNVYTVSFDRENLYRIKKNPDQDKLLRSALGWDEIEAEVVGYSLDYKSEWPEEFLKDMPESMKNLPVSSVMEVTEEEFEEFLSKHLDDFDITDNRNAQVPSVSYID